MYSTHWVNPSTVRIQAWSTSQQQAGTVVTYYIPVIIKLQLQNIASWVENITIRIGTFAKGTLYFT